MDDFVDKMTEATSTYRRLMEKRDEQLRERIIAELPICYCPECGSKYIGFDFVKHVWDCETCKAVFKEPMRITDE